MGLQTGNIAHLQQDNVVAIEMPEVMPKKDIKMSNEVETDGMKIVKVPEITIEGNEEDSFLLNLVKLNFLEIKLLDNIIQEDPSQLVLFLITLKGLIILNSSHEITSIFNKIIVDKLVEISHLMESSDSEDNSTDDSIIGDETGENT